MTQIDKSPSVFINVLISIQNNMKSHKYPTLTTSPTKFDPRDMSKPIWDAQYYKEMYVFFLQTILRFIFANKLNSLRII